MTRRMPQRCSWRSRSSSRKQHQNAQRDGRREPPIPFLFRLSHGRTATAYSPPQAGSRRCRLTACASLASARRTRGHRRRPALGACVGRRRRQRHGGSGHGGLLRLEPPWGRSPSSAPPDRRTGSSHRGRRQARLERQGSSPIPISATHPGWTCRRRRLEAVHTGPGLRSRAEHDDILRLRRRRPGRHRRLHVRRSGELGADRARAHAGSRDG